jgi:uncharacterized protein (DUF4415 family)
MAAERVKVTTGGQERGCAPCVYWTGIRLQDRVIIRIKPVDVTTFCRYNMDTSFEWDEQKRRKMNKSTISNTSKTDWERLEAMDDANIDFSDIPEITPEMFARAVVRRGLKDKEGKAQLTLRIDRDVLSWFKSQGRGYQTRINTLLRAYMEANVSQKKSPGPQAQR